MIRKISKKRTGIQIRQMMNERGVTVMQVQDYLDIDSPQAIYKWLQGVNLPSVIHLFYHPETRHTPKLPGKDGLRVS